MNDHNLDDLIIDNIDPKNSKTKSFLTIIALAIVVLIIAIILTKIVLKDPNDKLVFEENNTEMISPELTLQDTPKNEISQKTDDSLSPEKVKPKTIEPEISQSKITKASHDVIKTDTGIEKPRPLPKETSQVRTNNKKSDKARLALQKEKLAAQKILEEKLQTEKLKAEELKKQAQKKEKLAKAKILKKKDEQQETVKQVQKNAYYIQVGSFTQTPSKRFLSIIKNSGFDYTITSPNASGSKKLLIGPYSSRREVDTALVRVRDRINKSAFVTKK